jgi:hypothetical protein
MTKKAVCSFLCLGALVFLAAACGVKLLPVGEPPRLSGERLKGLLDSPDVVIVDVRHEIQWDESPAKIPGAVRGEAKSVKWAKKYPKDTFIVLYCA